MRSSLSALLLLAGSLLSADAFADDYVRVFGDYRVFYNAFSSDMLEPQIARSYELPRSRFRGLLNITVQRRTDSGYEGVPAQVDAQAVNLSQQLKKIPVKEVREGEVVYYLGVFPITNRETLDFDVTVSPEGSQTPMAIRFRQQFFTED